jgi:integrase
MLTQHFDQIGKIQLTRLTLSDVQHHYGQTLKVGLAPTTVHHLHEFFHIVLKNAVRLGILPCNPTDFVEAPRLHSKEIQLLSEAQVRQMLAAVKGHLYRVIYVTALATGMREGELLGLRREDVDVVRTQLP